MCPAACEGGGHFWKGFFLFLREFIPITIYSGAVHPYKRSQARGSGQAESHRHVMCNTVTLTAYPQTVVAGSNPAVVTDILLRLCLHLFLSPACEGRRDFF